MVYICILRFPSSGNPPGGVPTGAGANNYIVNKEVGRWGEALVYQYLLNAYPTAEVEWVNQEEESLACYDLKLLRKDRDGRVSTTFVEVKSSRFAHLNAFQVR